MEDEVFADFVGGVALTGSVVRMDLASLSMTEKDDRDQPKAVVRQRVIMPVEGFVRSFAVMARVMEQLEKQGLVKRTSESDPQTAPLVAPQSVNFK